MSVRSSQRNSRTRHYILLQIRRDKASAGGSSNWPIGLASLNGHACGSLATSMLVHEATHSTVISASGAVALRGRRRGGGVTARQRGLVSCHSRETGTENADLVLQAARETAASRERDAAGVFTP